MESVQSQRPQRTGIILGVIIVVIIVIALFIIAGRGNDANNTDNTNTTGGSNTITNSAINTTGNSVNATTNGTSNSPTNTTAQGSTKTINLTAEDFSYSLDTLNVNKGDTVKVTLTSASGTHNFTIDELNVKSSNVTEGNSTTVEFVANTSGEFTYYCSVGSHRDLGLRGTLVVK